MAEKQEKKIKIDSDILYDLAGDLNKCLKYLQDIPKIHPDFHRFELEVDYGYDNTGLILHGYRWETDKELASRLEKAKKERERKKAAKDSQEEKERKLYEELKKKFESPKPFGNY